MNKLLLFLLILVIHSMALAQIVNTDPPEQQKTEADALKTTGKKFKRLHEILVINQKKCPAKASLKKQSNFVEDHELLVIKAILRDADKENCEIKNTLDSCFYSLELDEIMKEIHDDPKKYEYIKLNYGLEKAVTDKILEYFSRPKLKTERN